MKNHSKAALRINLPSPSYRIILSVVFMIFFVFDNNLTISGSLSTSQCERVLTHSEI